MNIRLLKMAASGYDHFSNMAPFEIEIDGVTWPTTEHYYQAMKFDDPALREEIRSASSPFRAAAIGNDRTHTIRADWDAQRVDVMERAMNAKFAQHPDLAQMLLATGNKPLSDHTAADGFWGLGRDGRGQNMVGVILMRIRDRLRQTSSAMAR